MNPKSSPLPFLTTLVLPAAPAATLPGRALRSGNRELAEGLANERLALKPHSPINRDFLRRASAPAPEELKIA